MVVEPFLTKFFMAEGIVIRILRQLGILVTVLLVCSGCLLAAPTITTLSPATGAVGAAITITGTNFGSPQGTSTVTFNGVTATTVTGWTTTSMVATVPSGATTGNVVVTVGGVASNGKAFTVVAAPSITSLSPTSGPVATSVTITGTNFGASRGTSTVSFNGTLAPGGTWSATSIVIPVPTGATPGSVIVHASGVDSNGSTFTVVPTPSIASLSPTTGAVGASVTIAGSNFGATQGTSTVKFNGTTATSIASWGASSIVATVPTGAVTGNVVVALSGVGSNGKSFTVVAAPSISSLSPVSGVVGTSVSINGSNFGTTQGSGTVSFNGTAATTITSWASNLVKAPVPTGATTGNVVVHTSGVDSNGSTFTMTPNITSLSPSTAAVGASVTVTGTNFGSSQGTSTLKFNGTAATAVTSWTQTSIVATVPSGATTGNVVVAVNSVASNNSSFTVVAAPAITGLSPTTGPTGTAVTITGTNFGSPQGTGTLTFNGSAASPITSWNATTIVAPVPTGATTGNVVVKASGVNSNGSSFTVVLPPSISSLSPTSGPVGSSVTITGTNFGTTQGTSSVTFNGTTAIPGSWSATSIVVPVPSGATTGNVVVTANGSSSPGSAFTVLPTPSLTSLSPTSGAVGSSVTITGANFGSTQGSSTVKFNGTTATPTSWGSGSIVVPVPTGATTGNVVVTVSGIVSNTLGFTVPLGLNITSLSPTTGSIGRFVTISGSGFGATQGTSTVSLSGVACAVATWSDTDIIAGVPSGSATGPFSVTVNGNTVSSATFTVTTQPLPGAWLDTDVGNVNGLTGSATFSGGTFTVKGSGTGYYSPDGFHFAYQPLTGDGTIIARVVGTLGNGAPTAAIMIRESLSAGAIQAVVTEYPNTSGFYNRQTTGGSSASQGGSFTPYPNWLKLTRVGNTFTAYVSPDGVAWTQIGTPVTFAMATNAYIGIAMAESYGYLDTATFDSVSVSSTAAPAPVISSLSATTGSIGSQVTITGSNFGATEGASTVTLNGGPVTVNSWVSTSITFTVPTVATSGPVVVLVAPNMNASNAMNFLVTSQPLPSSWLDQDVGNVNGFTGSATYTGGTFTVKGSGSGYYSPDGFHFVYQSLTGDGSIVARVLGTQGSGAPVTALLIRESLSPGAIQVVVTEYPNTSGFYDRPTTGGSSSSQPGSFTAYPNWMKLTRTGNSFAAYVGPDGVNWTQIGTPVTLTMATNAYIGIAMAESYGYLDTATFDNVSVSTAAAPAPAISSLSATTGPIGSQVQIAGSAFGASQNGSLVSLNGIPMTIDVWSDTLILATIPAGATSGLLSVLKAPSMNSSNAINFGVTTQPLPASWLDQDVGIVSGLTGSATYAAGVFTVYGAGNGGLGNAADGFHFVYQPLNGDGSILARVSHLYSSNAMQVGVMIRESLSPVAADMFAYFTPNQAILYDRPSTGAASAVQSLGYPASPYPYWVQLVRAGNVFTAYVSLDGSSWTQIGVPTTVVMAQTVYIGLAISGEGVLDSATLDNVSLTAGTTPYVSGLSPLIGGVGTAVTIAGSNFGSSQGSSVVKFNGVAATSIVSWTPSQIVASLPSGVPSGPGPVTVTVNSIPSNSTVSFTTIHPVITSLTPPSAAITGYVTANGSGFSTGVTNPGQIHVSFNGVDTNPYFSSWGGDTSVTFFVPPGAASGPLSISINGVPSNSVSFTVDGTPTIGYFTPNAGPVGTPVTIHGTGFGATQSTSMVQFYGVAAAVTSWSDTQIVAVVPVGTTSGPVSVNVASLAATSSTRFYLTRTTTLTNSAGLQTAYVSEAVGGTWDVTDVTGAGCSSCSARGNIHNDYDDQGNLLDTIDQLGHTTNYSYDGSGNVTSVSSHLDANTPVSTYYTYNSFSEVLTMTDPLGHITTNTYDTNGNLLTVTSPSPDGSSAGSVTQFGYDTKGELTTITDPRNHVTTLAYFPTGLIQTITDAQNGVTTYGYDSRGNRTSVTDANLKVTTFAYDLMNRLTGITYSDNTTASFGYDSRGRRTSATDQNNKTTIYNYDDADRLTSVQDPALNLTQYAYDNENNLTTITDANNHVTTMHYDAYGRVLQTDFPSTLSESYLYDAVGNMTSKTDRNNHTIQYVYDALNRLTSKTYPDTTSANYYYDLASRVYQVNDPTGGYTIAYDNMGRQVGTATQYAFLPGKTYTAINVYDAASNRTTSQAPDGSTNIYTYDTLNRLSNLSSTLTGAFGFGYDSLGRRTSMTRPNGITTSYAYDDLSHLLSVLHKNSGGATLDGASYTYDNAGNRLTKLNSLNSVTEGYTYDPLYQLTQVVQGTTTTESYGYDLVGNRLSSLGVSPYNYNSSNELTSTPNGSYTYDNNGNTLTDPSGKTYTWDFENRLTKVVVPGTGTVTFKYDPFGRRIQKIEPSRTVNYLYSGSNILNELDGSGNFIAAYTQGVGVDDPLAQLTSGTASFYEADGLGSLTSLSNATGSLAKTYTYDSFGNLTMSTGTLSNFFQYTARESDSETALYYYRARYYDPTIGRFVSQDPSGPTQGPNLYAYVYNSPTGSVDPSGLYSIDKSCQGKCVPLGGGGPNNPGKPPHNVSLADLIQQGTDNACASSNTITDLKLRRCIQKSCNQGTIKCDCASKANSEGGFNSKWPGITNRTAHICTESWPNYTDPSYAATWYGQASIHEWAHGCGWNHGDGGGVPIDPGPGQ